MAKSAEGDARHLLSDGLGSVRQAVDENAELVAYHEFDPYGNPVVQSSNLPAFQPYGFTGEWWQDDLDLLFLRARWYQPGTGTFLSVDPVESEPPYQYVRGNPVNWVDPSGLCPPSVPECRDKYGRPADSYYRHRPIRLDSYIAAVITIRQDEIKAAASRHNLRPDFLAAVLYLENNNPYEQMLQNFWNQRGDILQQCAKVAFTTLTQPLSLTEAYLEDITFGKQYDYFKFGRSVGIGAIKPEVAIYTQNLGLVYDPFTGEKTDFPDPLTVGVEITDFKAPSWLKGLGLNVGVGVARHPFARTALPYRLTRESWSIEYLAAHLDAARTPKNEDAEPWPDSISKADKDSQDALRLMFTYHHNVDNLVGWDEPTHEAFKAGSKVLDWMPLMKPLLNFPPPHI